MKITHPSSLRNSSSVQGNLSSLDVQGYHIECGKESLSSELIASEKAYKSSLVLLNGGEIDGSNIVVEMVKVPTKYYQKPSL